MSGQLTRVYDYIDQHLDEHVEDVRRLIKQPSISFTGEGVEACANMLVEMIKEKGAERAERCEFEGGYPVVYGEIKSKSPKAKTIIAYSLYDVLPADEEGWKAPPFGAEIHEGTDIDLPKEYGKVIVGRGARKQKGPIAPFLNAVKSMIKAEGDVPVNVILAFEGEGEWICPHFPEFVRRYKTELSRANAAIYCNPSTDEGNIHNIYLGFRGVIPIEIEVKGGNWGGPTRVLGGSAEEAILDAPAWRLIWALASLKGPDGKIQVDGFYDHFRPPNAEEQELIKEVKAKSTRADPLKLPKILGVKKWKLGKPLEDLIDDYIWSPLINIDGLIGGHMGPLIKTNLPNKATAKIDVRLFPNMNRDDIVEKIKKHFHKNGFPEVEVCEQTMGNARCGYNACTTSKRDPVVQAAISAAESLGYQSVLWPIFTGSAPLSVFKEPPFDLPVISAGLGKMGNSHKENEYITLEGIRIYEKFIVAFLHEYARQCEK